MADSSIVATCAQTKPATLLDVADNLSMTRDLVEAVRMMAMDLSDSSQQSAFIRVGDTIMRQLRKIEADIETVRAGGVQ